MSQDDNANPDLDPVKIRADIYPHVQAATGTQDRQGRIYSIGLVSSLLVAFACLVAPLFISVDPRSQVGPVNPDEVVIYTDPPGSSVKLDSINSQGASLGATGSPIPVSQFFRNPKDPSQPLTSVVIRLSKDGYVTVQYTVTPMDLGAGIWPQKHQPMLRLRPANPLVLLTDYFPRYRPRLFTGLCLGACLGVVFGLLLHRYNRLRSLQESVRQRERDRDNLAGLSVLGHHTIERVGSGANSLVYLGVSEADWKTERALRFTRRAQITKRDEESFNREIGVLQKLDHPNIVKVFDSRQYGNTFAMVMEFIQGDDMKEMFRHAPLAPASILPIMTKIAAALDHAHQLGVVHRDLKPANIMLGKEQDPVIVDFGLAADKDVAGLTQTGDIKGTVSYMAPEQISGKSGDIGPAADQFAFGLILYEALSGAHAYDSAGDPIMALMNRINMPGIPFSEVATHAPPQVAEVIMKMISRQPEERFDSVSEGMAALNKAMKEAQWDLRRPLV